MCLPSKAQLLCTCDFSPVNYVLSKFIGISQSRNIHAEIIKKKKNEKIIKEKEKKDGLLDLVFRLGYEPINFLSVGRAERHNLPHRTALR